MRKLDFKEQVLPHAIVILLFIAVSISFFSPVVFENKTLFQHDIYQFLGSAKELIDYREQNGEEGLWTNSMFGGMPGYLISTKFNGDFTAYVQRIFTISLPPLLWILTKAKYML